MQIDRTEELLDAGGFDGSQIFVDTRSNLVDVRAWRWRYVPILLAKFGLDGWTTFPLVKNCRVGSFSDIIHR
ncbi:MAG TPA: hypothetical protein VK335_06125 [Bryobacteraceae bacterium]|nr:hypothetical protein [Bryobacteraceae bacterium]